MSDNDTECELAAWELLAETRRELYALDSAVVELESDLNEARATAKFWQEQYGHTNPEHVWQELPWENIH